MRRTVPALLLVVVLAGLAVWIWRRGAGGPARDGAAVRTLVLVTVDTLRRDRVGVYGRNARTPTPLTPRMDALAEEGIRFEDARTPVPLTLPGHAVMLTGLPPAVIGVRVNAHGGIAGPAERGFPLLAEVLQDAGWRTAAFVSASTLLGVYGLDQGFEVYDDAGLDDPGALSVPQRDGEETVARALAHVATVGADERLFLWVHLFEPHAPYAPALPLGTPTEVRYDADVARADQIVGTLLDGLDAAGRAKAVVLLTADHGEALDELGEPTHGLLLGDAVLRVPFLLRVPGVPPAVRSDPVDLADVAPTLAGLAGVSWPGGDDLLGPGCGTDLRRSPPPPDRIRVAESLYAHQRYRWAQLVGAVGRGGLLVDAGGDRILWLDTAPAFVPQAPPRLASTAGAAARSELLALSDALREYRAGERADRIRSGGVAHGYGHAGLTAPFLPPEENGALPDPYAAIARAAALDAHAAALDREGASAARIRALERMAEADPGNPELHFFVGRGWQHRAVTAATTELAEAALAQAEAAYGRAWAQERWDAATLVLWVGVNAKGHEAMVLERLRREAARIPPDCRVAILEARLLRALGRDAEAEAACARAAELCQRPWEAALYERADGEGTCR